jgi:hypothetical protein
VLVLDENIPESQRQLLRSWRIPIRQIGLDVGRKGMKDDAIVPLLHRLSSPTFFTRDKGFFLPELCHASYAIVVLAIGQQEAASFTRRVLRHPKLRSHSQRAGSVLLVEHMGIRFFRLHTEKEGFIRWSN